jgi:hypothetical protein
VFHFDHSLASGEPSRGAPTSRLLIGCQACQVRSRLSGKRFRLQVLLPGEENYFPWGFRIYFPQEIFPRFARDYVGTDTYVMKSKMRFGRARKTLPRPRTIYFPKMVVCPAATSLADTNSAIPATRFLPLPPPPPPFFFPPPSPPPPPGPNAAGTPAAAATGGGNVWAAHLGMRRLCIDANHAHDVVETSGLDHAKVHTFAHFA